MTALYLYDDERARIFEPFALTRPVGELRAGAELIRRRWEVAVNAKASAFISAPHLADFQEFDAPLSAWGELPAGSIIVNTRCVPALEPIDPTADVWTCGGDICAVRLRRPLPLAELDGGVRFLGSLAAQAAPSAKVSGWWLREVWDLVGHLSAMLTDDIARITRRMAPASPSGVTIVGSHALFLEGTATVEPHTVIDTSGGPVLIRDGATVQAFTRLMGPSVIGAGSTVVADRVAVVSVGEVCKVHGEVSNSVFLGHSNKGHDGFVGHSYLGRWVNLGAGTITSNLKNTYGTVALWTPIGVRDTGMQFLGTLFGDHVKTGIGSRLTTGTVLGGGANVYGSAMPPKVVPPFSWGEGEPYHVFDVEKFIGVAQRMMDRRHVELGERARKQLRGAHALAQERRRRKG